MTKTIYIAGPMRGIKYFNFPAFDQAERLLTGAGYRVVNPANLDRQLGFDETSYPDDYDWQDLSKIGFSLPDAVIRDAEAITQCDGIYLLAGWENSKGAKAERAIAEWLGLSVICETRGPTSIWDDPPGDIKQMLRDAISSKSKPDILEEALEVTTGDRQASYGPPDQDFRRTAGMWSALFGDLLQPGKAFEPFHVAQAMILLKMSRQLHQRKRDNWIDTAGYARCGALCDEVAEKESNV